MNQRGDIVEAYTSGGQLVGCWECVEAMSPPVDPHGRWVWHSVDDLIDNKRNTG